MLSRCCLVVALAATIALTGKPHPVSSSDTNEWVHSTILKPQTAAPGFLKIEPVATNLWAYGIVNAFDPRSKRDVFYITSFNTFRPWATPGSGQLIRLDYRHNAAKSWVMPTGIGAWKLIQGKDGNLYMGTYNVSDQGPAELLCFNPQKEQWVPLPQLPVDIRRRADISLICDVAQAPNGDLYYGTYPTCHLIRLRPRTGETIDLGRISDEKYLHQLAVTKQGVVLCGVCPYRGRIIAYDPRTNRFRTITPERFQTGGTCPRPLVSEHYIVQVTRVGKVLVYNPVTLNVIKTFDVPKFSDNRAIDASILGGDRLFYQDDDEKLVSLDLRTGNRIVLFAAPGTSAGDQWHPTREGNFLGLLEQSYVFLDIKNRRITHHRIPADGLGQDMLWLRSFPDGTIYGGAGLGGQTFFSYDPRSNVYTSYDQITDVPGEIWNGIPYQGKLYTASYVMAVLAVFDPSGPWRPRGNQPDSNPRTILRIPDEQYRPAGGIHLGPDGKMYIGTQPDYGLLGGALSVFDPITGKIEVHRNIVPDEEIRAVATDSRYVYCAADIYGGGGSKPVAKENHFFVWEPRQGKIIFDYTYSPQVGEIEAFAPVNGHAYFVLGKRLMDFDSAAQTLTAVYEFDKPLLVPDNSLVAARDGTLWGILGDELARIDPITHKVQFFPETKSYAEAGVTIGSDGTVYFGGAGTIWIHHPDKPSPPAEYGQ